MKLKRLADLILSIIGIVISSPFIIISCLLIWIEDKKTPFYIASRVGLNNKIFKMIKLRTMIIDADKSGTDSTSNTDKRITNTGKIIRKFKLDELTQLLNVLIGDMSFVGPRPNIKREVELYTDIERKLLSVKPGITDFASIVYSDEGRILSDKLDPDIAYHQLIRPGKSRLALFYIDKRSFLLDITIIFLTMLAIVNKKKSLRILQIILTYLNAPKTILETASRVKPLVPLPPPGSNEIVYKR